jgi:hypothetical protein
MLTGRIAAPRDLRDRVCLGADYGDELRLLSTADRAAGLQLMFSLDRDGVDVTLEASFAMAGLYGGPASDDRRDCVDDGLGLQPH